jgi:hypothetical protein
VSASEGVVYGKNVARFWRSDIIPNVILASIVDPKGNGSMTAAARRIATEVGLRPREKPVWWSGKSHRVYVVRDHEHWLSASATSAAFEVQRGLPEVCDYSLDWRAYLDGLAAEENEEF